MTSCLTLNFTIGQIYADRVGEVYKEYAADEVPWDIKRGNMWHNNICALLLEYSSRYCSGKAFECNIPIVHGLREENRPSIDRHI